MHFASRMVLLVAASLVHSVFFGCGDGTSESSHDGGGAGATSDGSTNEGSLPCDVQAVLADKCLRCHGEPKQNGAPIQFLTMEQMHERYGERLVYERIGAVVETDFMPPVGFDLDPPVEPLGSDQKTILLDWVADGAPSGGGMCE